MASTFGGYSIAVSGMYVSQAALTVTSQNLSNVNTAGFSRQQIVGAEQNIARPGGYSTVDGVSVEEIRRARDQLLDQTYRQLSGKAAYWSAKNDNLQNAQALLNEFPADSGSTNTDLQQAVSDFFNSWQELAKDPSSLSNRQSVKEYGDSLVDAFNVIDSQLQQLQLGAANSVKDSVDKLNDLARQVASLNGQITQAEAGGAEANDLRDARDNLLDQMSALANISVNQQTNGVLMVTIGGVTLVSGDDTHQLTATGDGSTQNPLQVTWAGLNTAADITSGKIKACLEDADQSGVQPIDPATLPYNFTAAADSSISNLRQGLNDYISTLAAAVNSLHAGGTGLDGSTGLAFFVPVNASQPLGPGNIEVNPLLADANKLAAAASDQAGDNTVANGISNLSSQNNFQFDGLATNSDSFYQSLVSWLGTTGSDASGYNDTQNSLAQQANTQRQAISSVSTDEEMSKLIMYQNAYSASARVLSTIDSLVAGLIKDLV